MTPSARQMITRLFTICYTNMIQELQDKADAISFRLVDALREGAQQKELYELQNELDETLYEIRQLM